MSSTSILAEANSSASMAAVLTISSQLPYLSSAFEKLSFASTNGSSFLNPSPMDLVMVVPRMVYHVGYFAFFTVPEHVDGMLGRGLTGSAIAEATGGEAGNATTTAISTAAFLQGTGAELLSTGSSGGSQAGRISQALGFQNVRGLGGAFSYMTSRWALGCFTMAIILNRAQIYASARRHITLTWPLRFALRILPIVVILFQIQWLLQAIHCQTSPDYSTMRYGKPGKHSALDFTTDGGMLYRLSSSLLYGQGDKESCSAVNMIRPTKDSPPVSGSLSLLWPLFRSLCLSQFIETLSCAVQGKTPMAETGMTIFEHSLAFAEAEAMVSSQLGWGPFSTSKAASRGNASTTGQNETSSAVDTGDRWIIFDKVNTPPEVLLIGLISSLSNLSSQVLGVLGMQAKFRLVNTGIWALCFMSAFVWSFFDFSPDAGGDLDLLRFPTVCIIGFIPHLLILVGILVCASIYLLALLLTALSPPPGLPPPTSLKERFIMAHENLHANVHLSTIRISMHEDFYTTLLKVGFTALTAASEAVFLNEGREVSVRRSTWLEEDRLREIQRARDSFDPSNPTIPQECLVGADDSVVDGVGLVEEKDNDAKRDALQWKSGYARERKTQGLKGASKTNKPRIGGGGVGFMQRGGRWIMAWEFFRGIFWLVCGWIALGLVKLLDKAGITRRPQWIRRMARRNKVAAESTNTRRTDDSADLEFWLLSDDGVLSLPSDNQVDVEVETRKRLQSGSDGWDEKDEKTLDSNLYGWWKHGGWWGEQDTSGEYSAEDQDDDTTSVISMSTTTSDADWESDREDGRRTPTQQDPYPSSREATPIVDCTLDASLLAQLLAPKNSEQRQETRLLAHHLASDRILTRSEYRRQVEREKSQLLTSTRYHPAGFAPSSSISTTGKLTPDEESELLENLIIARRSYNAATFLPSSDEPSSSSSSTWQMGAEGLGSGGPQCVGLVGDE
ncbi:MAG: hypothetical protein M1827_002475 [Pycnora praestabilis]|nr:MAG: hypothetical protein M1827_002475 [Pycnora praestabilis]